MSIFIRNKYRKIYLQIIKKAKSENRKLLPKNHRDYVPYTRHHILPKSIFPKYKNLKEHPKNSVLLTAKEHFICHRLLTKFTKGQALYSMRHAIFFMSVIKKHYTPCARIISVITEEKMLQGHSEEAKQKMKGRKPTYGMKTGHNKGKKRIYLEDGSYFMC